MQTNSEFSASRSLPGQPKIRDHSDPFNGLIKEREFWFLYTKEGTCLILTVQDPCKVQEAQIYELTASDLHQFEPIDLAMKEPKYAGRQAVDYLTGRSTV